MSKCIYSLFLRSCGLCFAWPLCSTLLGRLGDSSSSDSSLPNSLPPSFINILSARSAPTWQVFNHIPSLFFRMVRGCRLVTHIYEDPRFRCFCLYIKQELQYTAFREGFNILLVPYLIIKYGTCCHFFSRSYSWWHLKWYISKETMQHVIWPNC